jgi:hypothetical protein
VNPDRGLGELAKQRTLFWRLAALALLINICL